MKYYVIYTPESECEPTCFSVDTEAQALDLLLELSYASAEIHHIFKGEKLSYTLPSSKGTLS